MSELPSGWAATTLGKLSEYITSGSRDWSKYYANDGALFVRTQDINTNKLCDLSRIARVALPEKVEGKRTLIQQGDLLITITGANVGKCAHVETDIPEAYVSQSVALVRLKDKSLAKSIHKQLLTPHGSSAQTHLEARAYGMGRPVLNLDNIRETEVALAPLPEQKRIADKLDSVLARVDACRDRLDRLPALLKRFRQSILAAATSGSLTNDWRAAYFATPLRESNNSLPECWREVTFSEVCREITVGYVGKMADQYQTDGVPFLRSMNVRAFRFDRKGLLYVSPEFHKQVAKSTLRPGDMAIVRSGAPGVCCVVPDDLLEANCSDLVIARPGPELLPQYGCIFMNSTFAADFVNANKVGVAQAHFNVGSMKITPLPLPSLPEQTEIVRRVEILFAFADRLEARLATARQQVGQLTPALLAKAFRGELVAQDPADEPAAELLKRLAAQREAAPKTKRGRAKG